MRSRYLTPRAKRRMATAVMLLWALMALLPVNTAKAANALRIEDIEEGTYAGTLSEASHVNYYDYDVTVYSYFDPTVITATIEQGQITLYSEFTLRCTGSVGGVSAPDSQRVTQIFSGTFPLEQTQNGIVANGSAPYSGNALRFQTQWDEEDGVISNVRFKEWVVRKLGGDGKAHDCSVAISIVEGAPVAKIVIKSAVTRSCTIPLALVAAPGPTTESVPAPTPDLDTEGIPGIVSIESEEDPGCFSNEGNDSGYDQGVYDGYDDSSDYGYGDYDSAASDDGLSPGAKAAIGIGGGAAVIGGGVAIAKLVGKPPLPKPPAPRSAPQQPMQPQPMQQPAPQAPAVELPPAAPESLGPPVENIDTEFESEETCTLM